MHELTGNSKSAALMRDVIQRVAVGPNRGRDISRQQSEQVMSAILQHEIDPVQAAVFFIALRMKSESKEEFAGLFSALQQSISKAVVRIPELFCLADPFDGYLRTIPITPFVPAVLSACGLPTLVTGVETVGPKHGITAHKVYRLAGIETGLDAAQAATKIQNLGWAYLDQSQYAVQLFSLLDLRDRMVKRTAITTLERMLMPLRAQQKTHLVLGYVHKAYPEIYSAIAEQAGFSSVLLVKGVEGGFTPALNKPIRRFFFDFDDQLAVSADKGIMELPAELISMQAAVANDRVGALAVQRCLELGVGALSGEKGEARNSLVICAAQILQTHKYHASCNDDSLAEAVEKVQNCLDNGTAKTRFQASIANLNN